MVKGISRHIILVDGAADGSFEQAIFILPNEQEGISAQALVDEAVRIAKSYSRTHSAHRRRVPPWLWALFGAAAIGSVWLTAALL